MSRNSLFKKILMVMCGVALASCLGKKTIRTQQSSSGAGGAAVQETVGPDAAGTKGGADAASPRAEICKELEKPCPQDPKQTFCELREFSGIVLTPGHNLFAYAGSECEARKAVLTAACNRSWDIKTLDAIKCAPDSSDRKCPVVPGICITLFDPSRCIAASENTTPTAGDAPLVAWGANACVARYELSKVACSRNMNPALLQNIVCEKQSSYSGDCPPVQPSCEKADVEASVCEVDSAPGQAANVKISAEGTGKCLARFNLDLRTCMAGLSPAEVSSRVSCRKK